MKIRPVLQAHASSRRLVVVPATTPDGTPQSWVFAIRRTGLDGEIRAKGAVMALGPVLYAIAKQEAQAQERQATLNATADESLRAKLQEDFEAEDRLAAAQQDQTPEEMVEKVTEKFYGGIVPVLSAAIESMGFLKPDLEGRFAGLIEAKLTAPIVCMDLDPGSGKPVHLDPITVVAGPDASPEDNEFALSNLDETQRNLLVASVLSYVVGREAAKEVVPVPEATDAALDRGRVGATLRPETLQAARARPRSQRPGGGGARHGVSARGTGE